MENILEKIHKSTLKFLVPLEPGETYATIVDEAMKLLTAENIAAGKIVLTPS